MFESLKNHSPLRGAFRTASGAQIYPVGCIATHGGGSYKTKNKTPPRCFVPRLVIMNLDEGSVAPHGVESKRVG